MLIYIYIFFVSKKKKFSSQKESQDNGINFSQDSGGFRQHAPLFVDETQGVNELTQEIEACNSNIGDKIDNALPNLREETIAEDSLDFRLNEEPSEQIDETEQETGRMSSCSDIVEIKAPQAPSPVLIDLIDSDEDCLEGQGVTLFDGDQEQATIVMDNAEDGTERVGGFELSEAPKMLSRLEEGDEHYEDDDDGIADLNENLDVGEGGSNDQTAATNTHKQPSPRKKRVSMLKKRRKKKPKDKTSSNNIQQTTEKDLGNGIRKIVLPIATSAIKKETPVAQVIPYNRSEGSEQVERPEIAPGMVVFRGKVVSQDEVPKKSTKPAALIGGIL